MSNPYTPKANPLLGSEGKREVPRGDIGRDYGPNSAPGGASGAGFSDASTGTHIGSSSQSQNPAMPSKTVTRVTSANARKK